MTETEPHPAILILAAGASTRLGSPKQLIKIGDKFLLEKMVETALETSFRPVIVILGAYFEKIKKIVEHLPVHIVENKDWEKGMGSTISLGISYLENNFPNIYGTLIILTDQPYVTSQILEKIEKKAKEKKAHIVASAYENTFGPPAYFAKSVFSELKKLDGKGGAKMIFEKYAKQLSKIDFPRGAIDIDIPADVATLHNLKK